jgi:hypothetical protein
MLDIEKVLGVLFCLAGFIIIIINKKLTILLQDRYVSKGSESSKKASYITLYIRGLIIALTAIIIGLYMILNHG